MDPSSAMPVLWGADPSETTLALHAPGSPGVALSADERNALLARVRAGEPVELTFTARTFVQTDAPNRNYLRIKPSALNKLGRSFKGAPFLRDHDQRRLDSRGGTVIEARVERDAVTGAVSFVQAIQLSKSWAVEGVLDGTIDRFSIGFIPTGPVLCSVHKTPAFKECSCWPGDRVSKDSDARVEFVFTEAEGVEVSAVNVPAVTGTGVEDIRAALSVACASSRERPMMNRLLARLALAESAGEEQVLAEVDRLMADRDRFRLESETHRERARLAEGRAAEYEAAQARLMAAQFEADIEGLYRSGKLPMKRDAAGNRVPHELETSLRAIYQGLGYEAFKTHAAALPASNGPGQLQSVTPQIGTPAAAPDARPIDQVAHRLNLSPELMRETLSQLGITDEMVAQHGPREGI